ncbi:MAG: phage Gp37/Gp68 family protein [Gammaproteobacteria bacterium]
MSKIEWTDRTWNPVRGCSRVSEGCRNCYAERIATRFSGPGQSYEGFADGSPRHSQTGAVQTGRRGHWTGRVELIPEKLDEPLRWRKPQKIFVNSMSDLFHEALDFRDIAAVYGVMAAAQHHTFQVLTKRPARRRDFMVWVAREVETMWAPLEGSSAEAEFCMHRAWKDGAGERIEAPLRRPWPLPNVWEGASVEDQATADERILELLQTAAARRFISYEPALGPVAFAGHLWPSGIPGHCVDIDGAWWHPPGHCEGASVNCRGDCCLSPLDWIIVGGESGPGARPFDVEWARSTIRQCREARVACFVKQLGTSVRCATEAPECGRAVCVGEYEGHGGQQPACARCCAHGNEDGYCWPLSRKGSDPSEWPEDLRVREFPA